MPRFRQVLAGMVPGVVQSMLASSSAAAALPACGLDHGPPFLRGRVWDRIGVGRAEHPDLHIAVGLSSERILASIGGSARGYFADFAPLAAQLWSTRNRSIGYLYASPFQGERPHMPRRGVGLAARPGLLLDASRTLAGRPALALTARSADYPQL
jgi:hypothetical protein